MIGTSLSLHTSITSPRDKTVTLKETKQKSPNDKRPNAPSMRSVKCKYVTGSLTFDFVGGVDNIYVRLSTKENQPLWDGYISTNYNNVNIPELIGEFDIYCIDEYGNEFIGTLEFD